jgi:hypothetical protein
MINPDPAAEPTTDAQHDSDGIAVPPRIADVLQLVEVLISYGRFLAKAVAHGPLWRGFSTVAQFFGTAAVPDIAARVRRGIMRALALHAVLLQRGQRGRDLVVLAPRLPSTASGTKRSTRTAAGAKPEVTPDTMPTQAELEAWARRRPVGSAVTDICLDLGISPGLCRGAFWQQVFDVLQDYRGSIPKLMQELSRRRARFEKEDWKHPRGLAIPPRARDAIRDVLGFFIGEPPPDDPLRPFAPRYADAALATGPP